MRKKTVAGTIDKSRPDHIRTRKMVMMGTEDTTRTDSVGNNHS